MAYLEMYRGDNVTIPIYVTNPATYLPVDLTGMLLILTVKNALADADPGLIQKKSSTAAQITINADQLGSRGQATAYIVPADTSGFTAERVLFYDVQLKDTGSNIYTVDSGTLTVHLDVTISTI